MAHNLWSPKMPHDARIRHDLYSNRPAIPSLKDHPFPQPNIDPIIQPWYVRLWNWQPKQTLALKLIADFDIHGLKYTVQKDRHIVERVFWVLIQLASLSAAIYMSYDVVLMYSDSPVIVSFQPAQTSISQVPYPAITVCNSNPFRKSGFDNAIKIFTEERAKPTPNSTILELYETLLRQLDHMCNTCDSFSVKFGYSKNETTTNICDRGLGLCDGLPRATRPELTYNVSVHQAELIQSSIQTCGEMIPKCIWEGEAQNCSEIFTPVITDFGICCVFNMMPRDVLVKMGAISQGGRLIVSESSQAEDKFWTNDLNFDELLNIGRPPHSESNTYLKYQNKAGQPEGLSFIVDPEIHETFCASHDAYGFRILAHQSIEYPQVSDFGIAVGPSSEVFLSLQAEVTKAEPDIRNIDLEKRNCYYKHEYKLNSFSEYTWSNCISECIGSMIAHRCNCCRFDMPQSVITGMPFCEGKSFDCAEEVKVRIANEGTKFNCGQCRPSCNRIEYKVASSAIPLRDDVNLWLQDGLGEKWSSKNVSIVHAFYSSDTVYSRVRKRIFTYNELFANVGGILGLFLGFSVISAVEPIYFLYRIWSDKKSRRVASTPTPNESKFNSQRNRNLTVSEGLTALDSLSSQYYNKLHTHGRISKNTPFHPYQFLH